MKKDKRETVIEIRADTPEDFAAVRRVNEAAFETACEANLVEALRDADPSVISLVAEQAGQIVGHILFSPVTIESESGRATALGLAPMAVLPELQRQGIGSLLVRRGLEACRRAGFTVVVVLGHPEYYPRFGFSVAAAHGIAYEHPVPEEAFMVVELEAGALEGVTGVARFRPEFDEVAGG